MSSDFSPRKRGNFKILFFFGLLEKGAIPRSCSFSGPSKRGNFEVRLFFEHLEKGSIPRSCSFLLLEKGQPQAPLLLLLTALNRHANPNAVNVIDAKISIPTGHPQLKKA